MNRETEHPISTQDSPFPPGLPRKKFISVVDIYFVRYLETCPPRSHHFDLIGSGVASLSRQPRTQPFVLTLPRSFCTKTLFGNSLRAQKKGPAGFLSLVLLPTWRSRARRRGSTPGQLQLGRRSPFSESYRFQRKGRLGPPLLCKAGERSSRTQAKSHVFLG